MWICGWETGDTMLDKGYYRRKHLERCFKLTEQLPNIESIGGSVVSTDPKKRRLVNKVAETLLDGQRKCSWQAAEQGHSHD